MVVSRASFVQGDCCNEEDGGYNSSLFVKVSVEEASKHKGQQ